MGVTLRLILGVFLILQSCPLPSVANLRSIRETSNKNSTLKQDVDVTEKILLDSEFGRKLETLNEVNKESKSKTDSRVNNVNISDIHTERKLTVNDLGNVPKNLTTVKLEKSESYRKSDPSFYQVTSTSKTTENVIDLEILNVNKTVKEVKPEEKARSIDVDIDKYVSPEFHNINNVYTIPSSPDTEKYVDNDFIHKSKPIVSKNVIKDSEDHASDLTTPRTDYFDNKYKEAVESVNQQLEHLDVEPLDHIEPNGHVEDNTNIERLIENVDNKNAPTKLDYIKVKNIEINDEGNKTKAHKDSTVEEATRIYFESSYNDTKTIPESNEKLNKISHGSSKESKNDATVVPVEATTSKTLLLTTRKPLQLTKPPNNHNISHILSNKIEVETLKKSNLLPLTTTEDIGLRVRSSTRSTIDITKRGTVKYADYATTTIPSTARSTNRNKIVVQNKLNNSIEQVVQENQVVPVHVTVPVEEDQTVTDSTTVEVRLKIDNITEITTPEVETTTMVTSTENLTTVKSESSTLDNSVTTIDVPVTDATVTNIPFMSIRSNIPVTEIALTSTIRTQTLEILSGLETSTVDITTVEDMTEIPTTELFEASTITPNVPNNININAQNSTDISITESYEKVTNMSTTEAEKPIKIELNDKNETEIPITEINEITQNPDPIDVTTENGDLVESTTINQNFQNGNKVTENEITTTEALTTNMPITEVERTTIETITKPSSAPIKIDMTTQSFTSTTEGLLLETTTIPDTTTVTIATTFKTHIEHGKSEETTTESYIPQETTLVNVINKNYPSTTKQVIIYHIENVDNHTTLLPEIINPGYNYPTPDIVDNEPKIKVNNTTQTTVEDEANTEATVDDPDDNKGTIAAIIISSVGAVCLVILAGLLFIMRKRQKRFNYGERCTPVSLDDYSMDNVSVYNSVRRKGAARASKRSYGNPAFDDPVAVTHPLNFPALAKFSLNFEDIKAEFEEIPQISARISELPDGCETKNRYANVIPLPETRVFLNVIEGYPNSDYINANYVTGPKNTKGYYIACQGPMQNTVDDFWRMVWEQQSKVILMLTQLFENGIEKCADYLPPSEVLDCHRLFGDFQVTLKKREVKDKYIISSLQLKNMVSNTWREVTHFWYLGWPEKGVPKEGNSIIAFLIEARSFMKTITIDKKNGINGVSNGSAHTDVNPVVVHCSPGTGRTGVVIACDIAIREFEKTRLVDIPRIVYKIRRDRASSVQTKEQYEFIYKVVSLYAAKLTGGTLDSI